MNPCFWSQSRRGPRRGRRQWGQRSRAHSCRATEALWAQTSALQGQAHLEERLCTQMELLLITLNQHWNSQQELLEALHAAAQGFGHGLGSGLDMWAGITLGREEWSEGEEDEGQGRRRGWNDNLS